MDVDAQLGVLTQQIVRARVYFDLWWAFQKASNHKQYEQVTDDFWEFFRFDNHAHFVSMIVHCGTIWDSNASSISLPKVGQNVLDTKRFPHHVDASEEINRLKGQANGLLVIRHKAIAHRSSNLDYGATFKKAEIIPSELPNMMDSWLNVANNLRGIRGIEKEEFQNSHTDHFMHLMHRLGAPDLRAPSELDEILGS